MTNNNNEIKSIPKTSDGVENTNTQNQLKRENIFKKPWVQSLVSVVVVFGILAGFLFWQIERTSVAIDNSYLSAPVVNLTPNTSGILNGLYVKEGDVVAENSPIALVGSQVIYTKEAGVVSSAPQALGSYYSVGQTVVSIVCNQKMRVVAQIEETKGLSNVKLGQKASFTVDTFSGKTYEGVVSEIGLTSNDTGIAFSISDKRPIKKFNVYISFDVSKYPELKSGMSAKATVYTK